MKKIYLFSILVMGVVVSAVAQPNPAYCPTASVTAYDLPLTPPVKKIFIVGGPTVDPNDPEQDNWPVVTFFDGGTPIENAQGDPIFVLLDENGAATFDYFSNDIFIDRIEINYIAYVGGQPQNRKCEYTVDQRGPLPIKLTSFTGRLQANNGVTLDWTSSIEENSFKYDVMRSADGAHWETVGTLKAAGTSTFSVKYTFDDQLPSAGSYFYRLKQIDIDGKFEYSKVVYVNSKKGAGVVTTLFPNPTRGEIQLIGATSADLTPANLNIYSITGQRVKYRIVGANAISLDPTAPDGVYILRLKAQQFKVVKSQSSGGY